MTRKYKPFTSLSRRQRRARTQYIKDIIYRERQRCGGLHYDDCVTSASMLGNIWSWADVLFLGNSPDVYWNALILTTADEQQSIIEQMAMDEAFALLDAEEREEKGRFETTPDFNAKGKVISHTMVQRTCLTYSQFDELTFNAFVDKRIAKITRDNAPAVQAGYKILPGYAAGIGLQIIVAEPVLTREIIDDAIRSFLAGDMPLIT